MIEPLRVVNGELSISFVVGGRGGQSAPVSGTAVASLLQMEGPMLAMTLSNTVRRSHVVCIVSYCLCNGMVCERMPDKALHGVISYRICSR